MMYKRLTTEQKVSIADVTVSCSEAEKIIERCIIRLCGGAVRRARIMMGSCRLDKKIEMLSKLLDEESLDHDSRKEFKFISDQLKQLNARRNIIIHGDWVTPTWAKGDFTDEGLVKIREEREAGKVVAYISRLDKQGQSVDSAELPEVARLFSLYGELLHETMCAAFPNKFYGLSDYSEDPQANIIKLKKEIKSESSC